MSHPSDLVWTLMKHIITIYKIQCPKRFLLTVLRCVCFNRFANCSCYYKSIFMSLGCNNYLQQPWYIGICTPYRIALNPIHRKIKNIRNTQIWRWDILRSIYYVIVCVCKDCIYLTFQVTVVFYFRYLKVCYAAYANNKFSGWLFPFS